MDFQILGPLRAISDDGDEVDLGGAKRRAVLARLLVAANRVVSSDALIEDVWQGAPPPSALATLQSYVYQLRKALPPDVLQTRTTGYVLRVDAVDVLHFERLLDEAAHADPASPERIADRLGLALACWHGPALSEFEAPWARAEAARLDELRLVANEDLIDARLALGEHAAVVPELTSLVAAHPLRERLWAQFMLALYRCGRQSEALRAYGRLKRILGDELGIEPNRDLAALEQEILLQEPDLDWRPTRANSGVRPRPGEVDPASDPRPHTRRTRWFAAATVASVVIAATVVATVWARDDTSAARFDAPIGYRPRYLPAPCPDVIRRGAAKVVCGELVVPERRDRPQGRTIRLGVYRYRSGAGQPAPDPIVQVGSQFLLTEPPQDAALRFRGDSIYLAGRGFFGSQPRLTCPEIAAANIRALARRLRSPANTTELVAAASTCRRRWVASGVDLAAYSAKETAADVRDLAVALHLPRIDLLAGRNSTIDAREIAGRYPSLVRSVTLINPTPPDGDRWNGAITNAGDALERLFRECTQQSACNATYPRLAAQLQTAYDRAQAAPIIYTTADPSTPGRRIKILLDGDRLMQIVTYALDDPQALPLVAPAIAGNTAQAAVDFGVDRLVLPDDASWGALLSRLCVDDIATVATAGLDVEAAAAARFAFLADDPLLRACTAWDTRPTTSDTASPASTPTLVLQGALDPFTSVAWTEATASSFGDATVMELPRLGAVASSGNPCVIEARRRFLADPTRRIDPHACDKEIPPVDVTGG